MRKYLVKVALDHFALGLTIPITVIWQLSRGGTLFQVSVVVAIITAVALITDLPTGIFADKYGRKLSLIVGTIALGVSFILLGLASNFLNFCIYALLNGLGWSLLSGAEEAYVFETAEQLKSTYKRSISNVYITDEVATIVGLGTGALITSLAGLQKTIFVAAIALMLAALLSVYLLDEPKKHKSTQATDKKHIFEHTVNFFKKNSSYGLIMVLFAIYYEGGRFLWQPQLINSGLKIYELGLVYAGFKLFSITGSFLAKHHNFKEYKTPLALAGIMLAGSFVLISDSAMGIVIAGFCIYSFAENYTRILQSDFLNKAITKGRASILSLNNTVRNTYSAALTPILGIAILNKAYRGFIFLAVIQIVAALLITVALRSRPTIKGA